MKHTIKIEYEEKGDTYKIDISGTKSKNKDKEAPTDEELLESIIKVLSKTQFDLIKKLGELK